MADVLLSQAWCILPRDHSLKLTPASFASSGWEVLTLGGSAVREPQHAGCLLPPSYAMSSPLPVARCSTCFQVVIRPC